MAMALLFLVGPASSAADEELNKAPARDCADPGFMGRTVRNGGVGG
jgi:hypothetical protein